MHIIQKNLAKGFLKIKVTSPEDLWYLTYIIGPKDLVRGKVIRKINLAGSTEKTKITKKPMTVTINVIKLDYNPEMLRIQGTIAEGPEDIPKGSHQALNIELNTIVTIQKEKFLSFQVEKVNQAINESNEKILIVIHDRESAILAVMHDYKFEIIARLTGQVAKKSVDNETKDFYAEIAKKILELNQRYKLSNILIASPSFFKEYLMNKLDDEIKKKVVLGTCSSVTDNAIQEIIARGEIKFILSQQRISKETQIVNRFLEQILKQFRVVYGFDQTKMASEASAVEMLLVSEDLIQDLREKEDYDKLDKVMKAVEQSQGKIMIIASNHEAGQKLSALGGIGGLLRYDIQ